MNRVTRRLCFSLHRSVCVAWSHGLSSRRSRPPDMNANFPASTSVVLRPVLHEPQGAVPWVLTLSGGARFIAWRLRHPFLREWRRDQRHFWECQACLGYCPALRPILKRPYAAIVWLDARTTNTNETCECHMSSHDCSFTVSCVVKSIF